MTAAELARIAAAIDADAATEAANWPLSRERARKHIELSRAVATFWGQASGPGYADAMDAVEAALSALAE